MMQRSTAKIAVVALTMVLIGSRTALADQFHYNNILIGTRAVGLGGAFGAVADDASGVFYNPAGVAFALSNDISGSANAFYKKSASYKGTICGEDFVEESSGSVPSFFGGLQKLDRYVEGLVFAFGVYSIDSDLKDQDTLLEDRKCEAMQFERYHRTSNARASTFYAGAAVGKRITSNISVGVGLSYFSADELVQEYQDVKQYITSGNATTWVFQSSNVRERLNVHGVQPALGIQAALPFNLALGLTYKPGIVASQKYDLTSETRRMILSQAEKDKIDTHTGTPVGVISEVITPESNDNPIGNWPTEIRLGVAWFASPKLLWTFDATHYLEVTAADSLVSNGKRPKYNKEAVTNFATGLEYYLMAALPLRLGFFTNNDARPEIQRGTPSGDIACNKDEDFTAKYCGQPDHIDYIGESLFIAWVQPNSQIAAGIVLQQGKGEAQKLGDHQVQDVEASSYTFAFSATHNL